MGRLIRKSGEALFLDILACSRTWLFSISSESLIYLCKPGLDLVHNTSASLVSFSFWMIYCSKQRWWSCCVFYLQGYHDYVSKLCVPLSGWRYLMMRKKNSKHRYFLCFFSCSFVSSSYLMWSKTQNEISMDFFVWIQSFFSILHLWSDLFVGTTYASWYMICKVFNLIDPTKYRVFASNLVFCHLMNRNLNEAKKQRWSTDSLELLGKTHL